MSEQRSAFATALGPLGSEDVQRQWTVPLIVAAVALGAAVSFKPGYALAAAAAIPLALIVGRWPGRAAVTLLLWGAVKYATLRVVHGISSAAVAVEIAVLVLVGLVALLRLGKRQRIEGVSLAWFGVFCGFAVVAFVSWTLNHGDALSLFAGIRSLATMPILAVSLWVVGEREDFELLRWGGIALTLLQVPIATVQFMLGGMSTNVDLVNGTLGLGGSNILGIWMLAAAGACFYAFLRGNGVRWMLGSGMFMVVVVMSGARLCILSIPVMVVLLGVCALARADTAMVTARLTISVTLMALLLVGLVAGVYAGYARAGLHFGSALSDLNPTSLFERQNQIGDYSVPRFAYLTYGWDFLKSQSPLWMLGTGPASAGSGAALAVQGEYDATQFAEGLRLQSQGLATYASSASVVTQTSQFVSTLVEYGPAGLALLMISYVMLGVGAAVRLWRADTGGVREAVLVGAFPVLFAFVTLGTMYGVTWEGLNIVGLGIFWVALLSGEPVAAEGLPEAEGRSL